MILASNGVGTVAGAAPIAVRMLRSVRVGALSADNVTVSFVEDQDLHRPTLLGMSFLQRFRMTIDNDRNELILLPK